MKKIIIILLAIFACSRSFAQTPDVPQPNGNILNPSLDKFVGTWMWASGVDTLTLILKKENILLPFPENSRADLIIGSHIYKQGNTIVESSIENYNSVYADKQHTILGGNRVGIDDLKIVCTIKNISKNKLGSLTLTINGSHDQLSWDLENREGVKIGTFDYSFSYPRTLTLYKQ